MKKKESRYLIGYRDGVRTVWGKDRQEGGVGWVNTMPLVEATRKAEKMPSQNAVRVVFRLVPVVTFTPKRSR